jgi:predicted dehydrogenase
MKVAIAGTGNVATGSYLPSLAKRAGVELLYWNRTKDKAEAAASQFGGSVVDTLGDLCAADPDTILVLTSEKCRYEVAKELLAGKPRRLFFEKPLVARNGQANVTEEDFALGREILQDAKAIGCETAMVFNYRFFEQTLRASAIRQERDFGDLVQVSALINYACWSHCIDLIHHFGGSVASISALTGSEVRTGAGNTSPDVAVSFTLASGGAGSIVGTAGTKTIYPFFELVLSFQNGRLSFRGLDGDLEILDYAKDVHETYAISRQWSRWDHYKNSFGKSVNAYLNAVEAGNPPPVPGMAGLQELQFEAALRKSVRTGMPVNPVTDFPCDL